MFEYETRRDNSRSNLTRTINDMAKKGWRAVGFTCDDSFFYVLLEKLVEEISE